MPALQDPEPGQKPSATWFYLYPTRYRRNLERWAALNMWWGGHDARFSINEILAGSDEYDFWIDCEPWMLLVVNGEVAS